MAGLATPKRLAWQVPEQWVFTRGQQTARTGTLPLPLPPTARRAAPRLRRKRVCPSIDSPAALAFSRGQTPDPCAAGSYGLRAWARLVAQRCWHSPVSPGIAHCKTSAFLTEQTTLPAVLPYTVNPGACILTEEAEGALSSADRTQGCREWASSRGTAKWRWHARRQPFASAQST